MFKDLIDDFKILKHGFSVVHETQKGLILLNIICAVFEALAPFINIYMSAEILNELGGGRKTQMLTLLVVMTIGLNLLVYLIKHALLHSINIYNSLFERKFLMHLNKKILTTDYANVEDSNTHMKRQKIDEMRNMNGGGVWYLVHSSRNTIRNLFVILFAVVMTYSAFFTSDIDGKSAFFDIINSPVVSIFLLAAITLSVILTMRFNSSATKKMYTIMDGIIPFNRIFGYYINQYINTYKAGKEIRLYNQKEMILGESTAMFSDMETTMNKLEKNQFENTNINTVISIVVSCLVYLFVGFKALAGAFLIGNIIRYVGSINQFIMGFSNFMNGFTELRNNNECLKAYFNFIDIPDNFYHGKLTIEKRADNKYELEFHNVSFKYPGANTYALKNLNLKFTVGQRTAVVGMNGSGKTTMIKLLCRLYDPTEGEIMLNGTNIKEYEYSEYLSLFSVVFQDFKLFSFPLGQNISTSIEYDDIQAEKCLEMAGFKVRLDKMFMGLDTPIYKDFEEDGVEFSGGEVQKIAIARALYKNAPFIVLDEPTAALDPVAEYEIYSNFNEIIGDKTAIYISHRLSSCRFCDDIAVFHEGKLIQRGCHDTLVADESGKYYELWHAQARYYKSGW